MLDIDLDKEKISAVILKNNNLHIEIIINPKKIQC